MIQGMTLQELARELDRQAKARRDFLVPTQHLGFLVADNGQAALALDTAEQRHQPFTLTEHAHGQLSDWAGIPRRYYERMRKDASRLLETNVGHWLHASSDRRLVRTLDGQARAWLSDRYRRIDHSQIAEAALQAFLDIDGFQVVSVSVTDWKLYIQALLPRLTDEVRVGDPVQAGVVITNGEIGNGALDIQPMMYRLACANGMVTGRITEQGRLRRTHVGRALEATEDYSLYSDETLAADDRALLLKVRDAIKAIARPELFNQLVAKLREAAEGPRINNPVAAVEELARNYSLPERERDSVLEHLIRGGDYSRWGLANAVTATANRHESYDRGYLLEELGGQVISLAPSEWRRLIHAEAVAVPA